MPGIDTLTVLCLHCNGANNSTTFIDSARGHAITAHGNAKVSTTAGKWKFGGGAVNTVVNGDYLTAPVSTDWDLGGAGAGDFTLDFWVNFTATAASTSFLSTVNAAENAGWEIYWLTTNNLHFYANGADTALSWTPSTNTLYHVAIVRSGGTVTCYINGTSIGTFTDGDMTSAALLTFAANSALFDGLFDGYSDEIRISKGIARWTANFTPPVTEYDPWAGHPLSFDAFDSASVCVQKVDMVGYH